MNEVSFIPQLITYRVTLLPAISIDVSIFIGFVELWVSSDQQNI